MRNIIYFCIFFFHFLTTINAQNETYNGLISSGRYYEALYQLDFSIAEDSLNPELYYKKGIVYQELFKHDKAISEFDKAIILDSTNSGYYLAKAASYAFLGLSKDAVLCYQTAMEKDPLNMNGALSFAGYLVSKDLFNEAAEVYNSILKIDSLNSFVYSQMAFCKLKTDSLEDAVEYYKKALFINEFNVTAVQQLAMIYLKQNNFDTADSLLDINISRHPDVSVFRTLKGDILFKRKVYDSSAVFYSQSIELGESSVYAYAMLGLSYFFFGSTTDSININNKAAYYNLAKEALESAYIKDKENPMVNYYLGLVYSKLGDFDIASSLLEDALLYAIPNFTSEAYAQLGNCYRVKKDFESAVHAYKMSLAFKSENELVINNLGEVYIADLNNGKDLVTYFREFLSANKNIKDSIRNSLDRMIIEVEKLQNN